jgi:large subunit ribosomal protein L18
MDKNKVKNLKRARRKLKIRAKVKGTTSRPRLCVSCSNRYLYLQIIDDSTGKTLASAHSRELKLDKRKIGLAEKEKPEFNLGKLIAKKALVKHIKQVVFDRAGYKYHGRVKAVAEGARTGGLEF